MAISLATAASRVLAAAANIATEMGGGTTTAEVQALAEFLRVCSTRPAESTNLLKIGSDACSGINPT